MKPHLSQIRFNDTDIWSGLTALLLHLSDDLRHHPHSPTALAVDPRDIMVIVITGVVWSVWVCVCVNGAIRESAITVRCVCGDLAGWRRSAPLISAGRR